MKSYASANATIGFPIEFALGHTVHCLGHGFKSGRPIGPFLLEMFILF